MHPGWDVRNGWAMLELGEASQPRTMCPFVRLVARGSATLFGEGCKCEGGLPDGRHPDRHTERAERNHVVRGLSADGNLQIAALV